MRIYLRLLVAFLLLSAGNVVYAEAQQEKRVTGTVTSEGEPLPGVSVQVKGASSGTIVTLITFRLFTACSTVRNPTKRKTIVPLAGASIK